MKTAAGELAVRLVTMQVAAQLRSRGCFGGGGGVVKMDLQLFPDLARDQMVMISKHVIYWT